ncbi:hypothetical protein [Parasynechococcus sp.]|uniref:hypothetical protein n=1 Tax=Parasynechococcus sp. TaxID=3101203 RepID=UPI0037042565
MVLIALQAKETSQPNQGVIAAELGSLQTAAIRLLGGWLGLLPFLNGIWRQTNLKRREK